MVAELNILTEWMPEQMEPGSLFILENAGQVGEQEDPYWAVLACQECGTLGLITRRQIHGLIPVICGSSKCPTQFVIHDEQLIPRKPN
jgi:hypothetical protein